MPRHPFLKDLLAQRRRDVQEELRSLREAFPAEIVEVKDAEEQSVDDLLRELNFPLMEMKSETLREIDEAISRLESGTYGVCVDCRGEIPGARLRALPFVRLCRTCQDEQKSRQAAGLRDPLLEELFVSTPLRGASAGSQPRGAALASGPARTLALA